MRAILTFIGVVLGLTVAGLAPATAGVGGYSGNNPDGAVLDSTVTAGEDVVFVADCFAAGTTVTVAVDGPGDAAVSVARGSSGTNGASGEADDAGATRAVINADDTGTYTVTATGDRTCATGAAEASFTVVSASAGGTLPRTGPDGLATQLWLGGGLVALGIALVVVTVSRRRSGGALAA